MIDIAVLNQVGRDAEMAALAGSLELDLVTDQSEAGMLVQYDEENRLSLHSAEIGGKPFFSRMDALFSAKGKDPLMRAIGYKTRSVFDATAGWAADAMHIASHEIDIIACERNPVVFTLVSDGLKRCTNPKICNQLSLISADSAETLGDIRNRPEVVYLDPMYPAKPSSAAPKKPLQVLQELYQLDRYRYLHAADNETKLLNLARKTAKWRVVVKRPHHAPPIAPNPSGAVTGKLVRFDLYPPL